MSQTILSHLRVADFSMVLLMTEVVEWTMI